MTNKQKKEIECLKYFSMDISLYQNVINYNILTDCIINEGNTTPEEAYFLISDNGIKEVFVTDKAELLQLIDSKKWRLRNMQLYEDGILEGTIPYLTLIEDTPKSVIDFMAKTMFKGLDRELILNLNN